MTAPVPMTDAIPLMQPPPNSALGQNNANDFRQGLLAALLAPAGWGAVRQGVLHLYNNGTTPEDLRVLPLTTAGQGVRANAGHFVATRTGQGPYIGFVLSGPTSINLPVSSGSNPRYDTIVARVYDRNISVDSAGSWHGAYLDYVSGATGSVLNLTGTPGSAGTPPILPDGCVPLAHVERAPGAPGNTIGVSNIKDARRSASLLGGLRAMLPGDALNDPGYYIGEQRYRPAAGTLPALLDTWDGAVWRGTKTIPLSTRSIDTALTLASKSVASVVIPDPGVPYQIRATGSLIWTQGIVTDYDLALRLDDAIGAVLGQIRGVSNGDGGLATDISRVVIGRSDPLTGSHTVHLSLIRQGGGEESGAFAQDSPAYNLLSVDVVPV